MVRRRVLLAGLCMLLGRFLLAQIPPEERIPITDPARLEALGFPPDAENVAVWSRADLGPDRPSIDAKRTDTWGTASGNTTISGLGIVEEDAGLQYYLADARCVTSVALNYPLRAHALMPVPEGVRLKQFRFWAFDTSVDLDLKFWVYETCQSYGYDPPAVTLIAENETVAAIGQYPGLSQLNDLTANNRECTYTVRIQFAPEQTACVGEALRVHKLQFRWERQVSPPPAVASFNDVPTSHPYFQFVEALSKSGITGGCNAAPPLYCPDAPLTRGQMAVFLAKALGLQWP